uniref:Uncharacterized protein n=1 Tax=Panagrolaimus davidi TaxID=227884 RepID=A0A914Q1G7_9BILA
MTNLIQSSHTCFLVIFGNDALSALTEKDVEKLNGKALSQEQLKLVQQLNVLLTDSSKSTLSQVYDTWHQLKNTFPDNVKELINEWEQRRNDLLTPVLEKLEDAAKETGNATLEKIFHDFKEASLSLSTGQNIPDLTLWEYELLRQKAVSDLGNVSDVLMNIYTNLPFGEIDKEETADEWFKNLSSVGPSLSSRYNETLDNLRRTISHWKSQLKNYTTTIKQNFQQVWNNTKIAANNFKNQTKEWIHNEHPKVESAIKDVKTAFNDVGKRITETWNSFFSYFTGGNDVYP